MNYSNRCLNGCLVLLLFFVTISLPVASLVNQNVQRFEEPTSVKANDMYYEDTTGSAYGVYVSGNYAYVADGLPGLAVIDISDPTSPGTPVYMDTTGSSRGICVSGNYAYAADSGSGLAVINISDPTGPGTLVYIDTTGYCRGVYVSGDYAYVADGYSGLAVIDISDPTSPGTLAYMDTTGYCRGIYMSGDYAYVADGNSGLAVIRVRITDAEDPTVDHPNDVVYTVGATGNSITWHPSDDNPSNYVVYRNGVSVAADAWYGSSITVNIDGLSEGAYNYTLTVFDILENSMLDEVEVTVIEPNTTPTTTPGNDGPGMIKVFLVALAGVAVVFIAIAIVIKWSETSNPAIYHTS